MNNLIKTSLFGASSVTLLLGATVALAAIFALFGDAEIVQPGNVSANAAQLRSDASPGYGGVDFTVPSGTTFADLNSLSSDYMFESDDSCGGGSPRFQVNVDNGAGDSGNIFVYLGPAPSYTGCPSGVWTSSGDLLEGVNPVDTSQLDAGAFYDPYATALTKYGTYSVTGIQLVADASWAFSDSEQTVLVDNVDIDGDVTTFENKESCKKGGWQSFTTSPGPFKNQGQCVSYFAQQK